ncbi:hypothetical protein THOM_1070 [Trachipleistophora hominis]|uniref:Uncharacterized protein n=1 Tax=Trachipleistophora hominis TaxID=72359 RepID=L7JY30_TRAHO|nr:hypothetical protein THOM_1070 [Trachipleistophora hominis]
MHKIELEEQIIDKLEQIDQTFSSINKVLKDINTKIQQLSQTTTAITTNSSPWLNFFSTDTPSIAPEDHTSSDATHKYDVSVDDGLHSFDVEELPETFSSKHVRMIYAYVEGRGQVGLEEVYGEFGDVEVERMDIYIEMMIFKRFLGCRNGVLYAKRRSD